MFDSVSSVATPIGDCPRCGGQLYALLTHHCTTAVKFVQTEKITPTVVQVLSIEVHG